MEDKDFMAKMLMLKQTLKTVFYVSFFHQELMYNI